MSTTLKWAGREYECFMSNKGLRVEHLGQEIFRHWPDQEAPVEPPAGPVPPVDAPAEPPVDTPAPPADTAPPSPPTSPPTADLSGAINAASDGAVINLAPGNYGNVVITRQFSKTVTINGNGATITGLKMNGAKNITIKNLAMRYTFGGEPNWYRPVSIIGCSDIIIDGWSSTGDMATNTGDPVRDGYPTGWAFFVRQSQRVDIVGCAISKWSVGVQFYECSFCRAINNTIRNLNHDAIQFAESDNCTADGNDISEFHWHPQDQNHPDGIQFWSNATPTKWHDNLTITNNKISNAVGDWSQGVLGIKARNITVSNNQIDVSSWNGIQVYSTDGFVIDGNVIRNVRDPNAPSSALLPAGVHPRIDVSRTNGGSGQITNNVAPEIIGVKPGWIVSGNT